MNDYQIEQPFDKLQVKIEDQYLHVEINKNRAYENEPNSAGSNWKVPENVLKEF